MGIQGDDKQPPKPGGPLRFESSITGEAAVENRGLCRVLLSRLF